MLTTSVGRPHSSVSTGCDSIPESDTHQYRLQTQLPEFSLLWQSLWRLEIGPLLFPWLTWLHQWPICKVSERFGDRSPLSPVKSHQGLTHWYSSSYPPWSVQRLVWRDSKFNLQLLSQCGSTNCERCDPEVHIACCWDVQQPETTSLSAGIVLVIVTCEFNQ